jgi:hypothetical protein
LTAEAHIRTSRTMRLKKKLAKLVALELIWGDAALIERGSRFKKARQLLYDKYPQYPEEAALGRGDVIVELTPRHVFSWGLD